MQIQQWIALYILVATSGSTEAAQGNLLLGRPTSQSSTRNQGSPSDSSDKAVDGNTDGNHGNYFCTHSDTDVNEWWTVDLGSTHCIGVVTVYNRVDCCTERLAGGDIRVGPSSNRNNPVCGTITLDQINANQKIDLTCNMRGQYLSIHLASDLLQLCEVQAFAGECGGTQCREESYTQFVAERLDKHLLEELKARSKSDCAATCLSIPELCASFNWKESDKICQLNNAARNEFPEDVSSQVNWKHYGVDDSYKGECSHVTCENDGRCEPICGYGGRFVCHCADGFTGRLCQVSEACTDALGMSSGDIADGQILTSSEANSASSVRLSDALGWSAAVTDSPPWVKVNFIALVEVTGLVTKGGTGGGGWVTEYQLSYDDVQNSYKSVDYTDVTRALKTFSANSDTETEAENLLEPIIQTTSLTLSLISCEGTCSLRFEVLGCRHEASCSELDIGWTVRDRTHLGTATAVQTWVTPKEFFCHGVVTHWRFWAGRSVPFRAMVLRNVDNSGTLYDIIGINDIPAGDIQQVVTYQVPDDERIVVQTGDVIGLAWNSPAVIKSILGDSDDDDVVPLKYFSEVTPDNLNVNDRINASAIRTYMIRGYSIKAIISDWILAFKGAAGNNRGILADWTHTGDVLNADNAQLINNTANNYRNNFIYNTWNSILIQKVKVTLLDSLGFILADIEFDAVGTSTSDWFSHAKLLSSPWTDLETSSPNIFSFNAELDSRHMYINNNYNGCAIDAGWLCVLEATDNCAWGNLEAGESYPKIVYSKQTSFINWTSGSPGKAAAFLISVLKP